VPLFKRQPSIQTTGHAGDDQVLAEIAKHSNLDEPRHWIHYLYVADESAARSAAEVVECAGWLLRAVEVAADGNGWVVIAEQTNVVTSPGRPQCSTATKPRAPALLARRRGRSIMSA